MKWGALKQNEAYWIRLIFWNSNYICLWIYLYDDKNGALSKNEEDLSEMRRILKECRGLNKNEEDLNEMGRFETEWGVFISPEYKYFGVPYHSFSDGRSSWKILGVSTSEFVGFFRFAFGK